MANGTGMQAGEPGRVASLPNRRRKYSIRDALLTSYAESPSLGVDAEQKKSARMMFFSFSAIAALAKQKFAEAGDKGEKYEDLLYKAAVYLYVKDFFSRAFKNAFEEGTYRDAGIYLTVFNAAYEFFAKDYFQREKASLPKLFATLEGGMGACADALGMKTIDFEDAAVKFRPEAEKLAKEAFAARQ